MGANAVGRIFDDNSLTVDSIYLSHSWRGRGVRILQSAREKGISATLSTTLRGNWMLIAWNVIAHKWNCLVGAIRNSDLISEVLVGNQKYENDSTQMIQLLNRRLVQYKRIKVSGTEKQDVSLGEKKRHSASVHVHFRVFILSPCFDAIFFYSGLWPMAFPFGHPHHHDVALFGMMEKSCRCLFKGHHFLELKSSVLPSHICAVRLT